MEHRSRESSEVEQGEAGDLSGTASDAQTGNPSRKSFRLSHQNYDVDEMIQRFEVQENSVHCQRLAMPSQNYDLDSDRPPNLQIPD